MLADASPPPPGDPMRVYTTVGAGPGRDVIHVGGVPGGRAWQMVCSCGSRYTTPLGLPAAEGLADRHAAFHRLHNHGSSRD